jgi:hypothetical protein
MGPDFRRGHVEFAGALTTSPVWTTMVTTTPDIAAKLPGPALPTPAEARAIWADAVRRYADERRARVEVFVDRHFTVRGSLRIHAKAVGWDVLRAPLNLALAVPHLATRAAAAGARRAGWTKAAGRLDALRFLVPSDVAREVEWLVFTELLELPHADGDRRARRDALAEAILSDPRVSGPLLAMLQAVGRRSLDPAFRAWLTDAMGAYAGTRAAAADLANSLAMAGTGSLLLKEWTPGALSLGPALAQILANHAAVSAFPLGSGLGGLWYGAFPAASPLAVTATVTGGLIVFGATLAAFAGVLTDPVQRRLGLHRRRLVRLIDGLERALLDEAAPFTVRDHYLARLFDLLDVVGVAWRAAR